MKKALSLICAFALCICLCACGSSASSTVATEAAPKAAEADKTYSIGICQLTQHQALDAATQGFMDRLGLLLGDKVSINLQNASGDSASCSLICNQFVSDGVDLIMANATPALLAAASATNQIPILGTSVTDYGSALAIDNWQGFTGLNISGTSDLAPLQGQADMLLELFPEAKTVGILFCSGEPNSLFQAEQIRPMLEAQGLTVKEFSFADSNDVSSVTAMVCDECDVIYIPTDNTAASCVEAINNVALNAAVPIITGEENMCAGCGVASLSISYYDLGVATADMAFELLTEGKDVSQMEIRFAPEFTKKFNAEISGTLNIEIPSDYVEIE